jgi:hypothetical protein
MESGQQGGRRWATRRWWMLAVTLLSCSLKLRLAGHWWKPFYPITGEVRFV